MVAESVGECHLRCQGGEQSVNKLLPDTRNLWASSGITANVVSPDGKQISFDSNTGGDWQIYVMDADGGKPKPLTNDKLNSFVTSWSRDGRWVYFGRGSTGNEQIWKITSQGGTAVQNHPSRGIRGHRVGRR